MNAADFRRVILYMANYWTYENAISIYGLDLGAHFFRKWASYDNPDLGTMRLFYEMTTDNLQKLIDAANNNK